MEIQINRTKNKKVVIDEASSIMISYKKLFANPHKKILKISTRLSLNILILGIYLLLLILYTCFNKTNIVFPVFIGISFALIILKIVRLIIYIKNLNKSSKINPDSILTIDEEKIELNNLSSNIKSFMKWEVIKMVLITDNCIVFMGKLNNIKQVNSIIIPIDYKNEVINALEKYNKLDLLIYNKR